MLDFPFMPTLHQQLVVRPIFQGLKNMVELEWEIFGRSANLFCHTFCIPCPLRVIWLLWPLWHMVKGRLRKIDRKKGE
jgi:hypothetical protein